MPRCNAHASSAVCACAAANPVVGGAPIGVGMPIGVGIPVGPAAAGEAGVGAGAAANPVETIGRGPAPGAGGTHDAEATPAVDARARTASPALGQRRSEE